MSARQITCAVIRGKEDDGRTAKYLIVVPEDRIVWVATTGEGKTPDLSPEGRKRSATLAGIKSLTNKLNREQESGRQEADILDISDQQIDCRDRHQGKCTRYPHTTQAEPEHPEGASAADEEECHPGVLECWMLEDEID